MTQDLFVSTRKGLFRFQRSGGKWQQTYVAFLGQPVTAFLADPRTGHWYAALNLGHFGAKLHRSTNQGATWEELTMPTLPKSEDKDAPSLNQIWALEAGGADQPGLIWAGSLPAALFRNDRNGEGDWQLVEGLWNLPDRAKWFGGGTDDTALHTLCIDPRNSSRLVIAISCGGVWRSEDAGASWTCRSKGLFAEYMPPDRREDPAIQDPHRIVQCRDKPDHFWCQHHNGIFFSTNDLESWQFAGPRFGFGVAVHPKEPAKAWFVPAIKDEVRVPAGRPFRRVPHPRRRPVVRAAVERPAGRLRLRPRPAPRPRHRCDRRHAGVRLHHRQPLRDRGSGRALARRHAPPAAGACGAVCSWLGRRTSASSSWSDLVRPSTSFYGRNRIVADELVDGRAKRDHDEITTNGRYPAMRMLIAPCVAWNEIKHHHRDTRRPNRTPLPRPWTSR